jgi:hypothetical protein
MENHIHRILTKIRFGPTPGSIPGCSSRTSGQVGMMQVVRRSGLSEFWSLCLKGYKESAFITLGERVNNKNIYLNIVRKTGPSPLHIGNQHPYTFFLSVKVKNGTEFDWSALYSHPLNFAKAFIQFEKVRCIKMLLRSP